MAVSTANTKLYYYESTAYEQLVDIVNYPDMGSTPDKLDTTDLSAEKYTTNIFGLQEVPDLTFEANYNKTDYEALVALEGDTQTFKLEFGDEGVDGEFYWTGKLSVFIMGSGVNEVRKMQITLSAENAISTTDPNA